MTKLPSWASVIVALVALGSAPGAALAQEIPVERATRWPPQPAPLLEAAALPLQGTTLPPPSTDLSPQATPPSRQEDRLQARDDGRRTVTGLPGNLFKATVGVFSGPNLKPFLVGGGAAAFAWVYDAPIAEVLDDPDSRLGSGLTRGGQPRWSGAIVGALFVGGRFARGTRFRDASYDWLEAYVVNLGYTELTKRLVGRQRPNGQDNSSFPSGHASNAFALAAVAESHYGWKAGVAAYGVASLVAVSRLKQNAHYLSDVLGGATLGYIVGKTVVRLNDRPRGSRTTQVIVSPALSRNAGALVVHLSWR
jgi:membrane-associated phospholipid phosphatase